jgi:hypothetical protein
MPPVYSENVACIMVFKWLFVVAGLHRCAQHAVLTGSYCYQHGVVVTRAQVVQRRNCQWSLQSLTVLSVECVANVA